MPKLLVIMFASVSLMFARGEHIFGVGGKPVLCVKDADMDPLAKSYADESTHLKPGSGHTPGFPFLFGPDTMKSIIPEYVVVPGFEGHPYVNTLSGGIGFLGQDDRGRFGPAARARAVEEEWYARGDCTNLVIKSLMNTDLYEVKCNAKANYSAIWNRLPEPKKSMPNPHEFVVAACQEEHLTIGLYSGRTLKNCTRIAIIDEFYIDYKFQEDNAPIIPQIDLMIIDKIIQWKRNCSTPT